MIDFEGTIDGEPFEGSTGKDFTIELGSDGLMPEFDDGLAGKSAGDEARARGQLPGRPPAGGPRRQDAAFAIKVKEVREKELPALDDDFASVRVGVRHPRRAARGDPHAL